MSFATAHERRRTTRTREERERDNAAIEMVVLRMRHTDDARRKLIPDHDKRLHSKVAGVTYANEDGSLRQSLIHQCAQFDMVRLERRPDDHWDANCICVYVEHGGQSLEIGNLPADVSADLAPEIDSGRKWHAIVTGIGGYIARGVSLMLYRESCG